MAKKFLQPFCGNPTCKLHKKMVPAPDPFWMEGTTYMGIAPRHVIHMEINGLEIKDYFCDTCFHAAYPPVAGEADDYFRSAEVHHGHTEPVCFNPRCTYWIYTVHQGEDKFHFHQAEKSSLMYAGKTEDHKLSITVKTVNRHKLMRTPWKEVTQRAMLCDCCIAAHKLVDGEPDES